VTPTDRSLAYRTGFGVELSALMSQRLAGYRTVFVASSPGRVFDRVFAVLLAVVVGFVVVISVVVELGVATYDTNSPATGS
jgi:hypothetical protein